MSGRHFGETGGVWDGNCKLSADWLGTMHCLAYMGNWQTAARARRSVAAVDYSEQSSSELEVD